MKKNFLSLYILILSALVIFSTSSCSKSSDAPENTDSSSSSEYYIKFKIDGKQYTYTGDPIGTMNARASDSSYGSSLGAQQDAFVMDTSTISVIALNTDSLITGITYTNYGLSADSRIHAKIGIIGWFDDKGEFFSTWDDAFSYTGILSDAVISYEEITSEFVKGRFSGTMYHEIDGSSEKHVVTEGQFYIRKIF